MVRTALLIMLLTLCCIAVIAFSICVLMIASIRIPNLKVASVLLVAVLFYDVFWVYVSPYIWHKNVM